MDARSKRREATRRQLEEQLRERQAREARRKRVTLFSSIGGTVVLIAVVVVLVVTLSGGSSTSKAGSGSSATTAAASSSAPASSATSAASSAVPAPTTACTTPTGKSTASFDGVTVASATDLKHEPKVSSHGTSTPTTLSCMDLVVGKGAAATPTSTVTVQYTGVLYSNGKEFDSSWSRGQATQFSLEQVVPGFTQGIGGAGKVAPMRVGGRRIMILPAALGYGDQASGSIPANSTLVFVVDLVKVG